MTTLKEAHEIGYEGLEKVCPEIRPDGIEMAMLWHSSYYDGPLSGVCLYQGRKHWFKMVQEGSLGKDPKGTPMKGRVFAVVAMTDEQIMEITRRREVWCDLMGGPLIDYVYENGRRKRAPFKSSGRSSQWDKYMEVSRDWPPFRFDENRVMAWWGSRSFDFDAVLVEGLGLGKETSDGDE